MEGTPLPLDAASVVERFRAYLRMRTDHPAPERGYTEVGVMLQDYARATGLSLTSLELEAGHPIYALHWAGKAGADALGSVMLSCHMDVVPAETMKWTRDPWAAHMDADGKIYARGTQDMKCVGSQYLEAVARLVAAGYVPTRHVWLVFVPDEEVGGNRGMKLLLSNALIKRISPAVVLDEGLANPTDRFSVFYGERKIWWLRVRCTGAAGHGSRFVDGTAVPKLLRFANHMMELREGERKKLEATCGCGKQLGDFTTINMTMMRAGDATRFQYNVIPIEAEAGFDCRIPATVNLEEFKAQIDAWAAEEPGVTWELVSGTGEGATENPVSDVSSDSYWWGVFQGACKDAGAELCEPSIFPAATDSRWIRLALGTPCFGFSPMRRLPILLHDHDEYITRESFLEGIDIYTKLIPALADALGEKAGVGATAPGMESCVRE